MRRKMETFVRIVQRAGQITGISGKKIEYSIDLEMVSSSGFAENFNAVTGEGLRDRSYTWTASAFLVMCHEFL